MTRKIGIVIRDTDAGEFLLDFLSRRFTYQSSTQWKQAISENRLMIGPKPADAETRLTPGDRLSYHPEPQPEPPVDRNYAILYEDEYLLAVNKPPNLPCHPAGRYFENSLWSLLRSGRYKEDLSFVHRIDRETSGLVLIARNPRAAKGFQIALLKGRVRKSYLCIVEGAFPGKTLIASGGIGPDPGSRVKKRFRFYPDGEEISAASETALKTCSTRFRKMGQFGHLSLVAAFPETGRTHQIRATLSGSGFPLVGDKLYGPDESLFLKFISDRLTAADMERLRLPRQALHAARLQLPHPETGKPLCLDAPMPRDMIGLLWPNDPPYPPAPTA